MAAKKHTQRTTSDEPAEGRQPKDTTDEAVPAQTPTQAELASVEAAQAANAPTAETTRTATLTAAEGVTTEPDSTRLNQPAPVKRLSALDAAAKVLVETGQAMSCAELIAAMAAKGYWSSPKGRTPAATLYSALLRELQTKGENARFVKAARGQFRLRGAL